MTTDAMRRVAEVTRPKLETYAMPAMIALAA
jgi:hypothetical protein